MPVVISDLKPGRALAFEHCVVQFAGRTLILAKYAVATPHPTVAFSALHFAARDVPALLLMFWIFVWHLVFSLALLHDPDRLVFVFWKGSS